MSLAEWSDRWKGAVWVAIGVILFIISRFDALRDDEAIALAVAAPIVALAVPAVGLRNAGARAAVIGLALVLAAAGAAEWVVTNTLWPGPPIAQATLTPTRPDARLHAPADSFDVVAHADLLTHEGEADVPYDVAFERGTNERHISGRFSRHVGRARRVMRRAAPSRSVTEHMTDRSTVALPARGEVRVHLETLGEGVRPSLRVAILPQARGFGVIAGILAALLLAAAILDVRASREGEPLRVAFGVGIAAVLAIYVRTRYEPDDPFTVITGAILVAAVVGTVVAWLVSQIAKRFAAATPRAPSG